MFTLGTLITYCYLSGNPRMSQIVEGSLSITWFMDLKWFRLKCQFQ